jgi:transposase
MAMKRRRRSTQQPLWVSSSDLPRSPGHPFYVKLNKLLSQHGFDEFVESRCSRFYSDSLGRPSIPPGVYFRMLLVGFFEGIDSERGIAWRCADSMSLREFLGYDATERTPDHSTLSVIRQRLDLETHEEIFGWVLNLLADQNLLKGKTVGVDGSTLEANAAMRSIVRRDTGASYDDFLTDLAKKSGIETPTREDLARLDRKRPKKTSNQDWRSPTDPDAKIAKMKDGRTHLAHKVEHAVDMETTALLAVTLHGADQGDTTTIWDTVATASESMRALQDKGRSVVLVEEVVADKGYHSNETLELFEAAEIRGYVSEPKRGRRRWEGKKAAQAAVYANRRRATGNRGRRLMRQRGERIERTFAHCYETGGMRRVHLRGHQNILKRLLVHGAGYNLALAMRKLYGAGVPRAWADLVRSALQSFGSALWRICRLKGSVIAMRLRRNGIGNIPADRHGHEWAATA